MIDYRTYHGSVVSVAQNEDEPHSYFRTFLTENPKIGYLTFDVFEDSPLRGRIPVPNARITVSRDLGGGFYFSKIVVTNENGETESIPLPAVSRDYSLRPGGGQVSTAYQASIEAPGYVRQDIYYIHIFDGITTNQNVPMEPNPTDRPTGANRPDEASWTAGASWSYGAR